MSENINLKFVILVKGRFGKILILNRYFNNNFKEIEKSTIKPSFYEKNVIYNNNYYYKILDTTGQEEFNAINNTYFKNCVGALIVYDATIPETFEKAKIWMQTLYVVVGKDIIVVISGNNFYETNKELIDEYKLILKIISNRKISNIFIFRVQQVLIKQMAIRISGIFFVYSINAHSG